MMRDAQAAARVIMRRLVTVYVQREQFAKFVPRVSHSGVRYVNSYADYEMTRIYLLQSVDYCTMQTLLPKFASFILPRATDPAAEGSLSCSHLD